MAANPNRKGTPRRGTPRSGAPRQAPAAPSQKGSLFAKKGPGASATGPNAARPAGGSLGGSRPASMKRPKRASVLGSRKPAGGLISAGGKAPARKPAQPKPPARPQARRSAPVSAKGAAGRRKGSPKLELKNPFAGIGGKKPAATPGAVASAGPVPSFIAGGSPAPATGREARERYQRAGTVKALGIAAGAICVLGVVVLIAFFALRDSSLFSVDTVEIEASTHVTESDVSKLLTVAGGTTLLNVDSGEIEAQLKRDPWVQSVQVTREFPHTLKLTVQEQSADLLVVMASGSLGWYLGSGGTWIEPVKLTVAEGQSVNDAALKKARSEGVTLVTGAPATVDPVAGSAATDEVLTAVQAFRSGFSADFSSKVVSYEASSADAVSCVLESGVRILLGSATNISYKEEIASALIAKYPGQVTYINVRTPSSPSVRRVGSDDVTQGTGADGGDEADDSSDASSASASASSDASSADAASTGSDSSPESAESGSGGAGEAAAQQTSSADASAGE